MGKGLSRGALALAVAAVAAAGAAAPASAADGVPVCTGNGTLHAQNGSPASWQVSGSGSCLEAFGPTRETQTLRFKGAGTSQTLGLCTPGNLLVRDLRLDVRVVLTGVVSGDRRVTRELWTSPVSLFPIATPFLITKPAIGAGLTVHRIFIACGDGGHNPSATFAWARL